jgi:peroxiredoxin Q/BCP
VTAIVTDRREKIRRYIEETGLPFDVLIDQRQDVVRAYGVWHRFGFLYRSVARPAAFLIDPDGSIRASWIGENQTQFPTADEILAACQ